MQLDNKPFANSLAVVDFRQVGLLFFKYLFARSKSLKKGGTKTLAGEWGKRGKNLFAILLLLFLFMLFIPISYNMDTRRYALLINGGHEDTEKISIQIIGRYTWHLLRRDRFRGNFMIEGYPVTLRTSYLIDIYVGTNTHQWLDYRGQGGSFMWHTIGIIYVSSHFRYFVILPFSDAHIDAGYGYIELSGETITAIVYPANTRIDAVQIVNDMVQNLAIPMR